MRGRIAGLVALGLLAATGVHAETVTIGYQTTVVPEATIVKSGALEKATGWTVDWRRFDSGAEVIAAMASGDVQIGYVGSSPLTTAASRGVPIETIFIAGLIGDAEALVVRNGTGIEKPADLKGKRLAVPFVSTTHYSAIAALEHWKIQPSSVTLLNMRPPEIIAAWQRGDIDAAYVWDPALGRAKETGKVLVTSAEVANWGAPTFDAHVARKDFAEKHPKVVEAYVRLAGEAQAKYRANPAAWGAGSAEAAKIAGITGAKPDEVPALLAGYTYPTLAEQASNAYLGGAASGGTAEAIKATATFLKDQGKIPEVKASYAEAVTPRFVAAAAK